MTAFTPKPPLQQQQPSKRRTNDLVLKKSDAKLNNILVKGMQIPGYSYQRLCLHKHKSRINTQRSFLRVQSKPTTKTEEQMKTLFQNTAIKQRLKTLQIQIPISPKETAKSHYRKYSLQKNQSDQPNCSQRKTNGFTPKIQKQCYFPIQTCTLFRKSLNPQKIQIQKQVRHHCSKNRGQNPLWISQMFINCQSKNRQLGKKSTQGANMNELLLGKNKGSIQLQMQIPSQYMHAKPTHSVPQSTSETFRTNRSKSRVCYSIKIPKQSKHRNKTLQNIVARYQEEQSQFSLTKKELTGTIV